jgi:uncharacterized membrane protein YeaQ/YmgE (transglycosylase-associated protein family)
VIANDREGSAEMDLIVMMVVWVVIGLLMGLLAGSIWKGVRPIGEAGDYLLSIAVSVVTGLLDWYIMPLLNIEGVIKLVASIIEPALVALFVLWLVRKLKKT